MSTTLTLPTPHSLATRCRYNFRILTYWRNSACNTNSTVSPSIPHKTYEYTIHRLIPVNVTDQGMTASVSNATIAQAQPVTLVCFTSTTQAVPPNVSQVTPQVTPVRLPLSQIKSVASTAKMWPIINIGTD